MNKFYLFDEKFDKLKQVNNGEWIRISDVLYGQAHKGNIIQFINLNGGESLECEILDFQPVGDYDFRIKIKMLDK